MDSQETPTELQFRLLSLLSPIGPDDHAPELSGWQVTRTYERHFDERIAGGLIYTEMAKMTDFGWVHAREDESEGRRTRWFRLSPRGDKLAGTRRNAEPKPRRDDADEGKSTPSEPNAGALRQTGT